MRAHFKYGEVGLAHYRSIHIVDLLCQQIVETIATIDVDPQSAEFIVDIVRKIMEQLKQTSIRGYRFAKSAGKR